MNCKSWLLALLLLGVVTPMVNAQAATETARYDVTLFAVDSAARQELDQLLFEAALAQLHPDFVTLWKVRRAASPEALGAIYAEAFVKLSRFQQLWHSMDITQRELIASHSLTAVQPIPPLTSSELLAAVTALRPNLSDYDEVRTEVKELMALPLAKHWPKLDMPTLHPNESSSALPKLRSILRNLGDMTEESDQANYDQTTVNAVVNFQARHGLTRDGVIGRQTREWLNATPETRARVLLRNLWRRDVVDQLPDSRYILVNIPDYRLSVMESGKEVFVSRVIVGQELRATPILASHVQSIVVNPPWHVPRSILTKDIIPKLQKNPNYINEEQFEVIDGEGNPIQLTPDELQAAVAAGFPYRLRQKPGDHNSLGRYKFYLPNNESVYLHSTPKMGLFNKDGRALSSGCVRVEKAGDLAQLLLQGAPHKLKEMDKYLQESTTRWVTLVQPVPVFTVYWSGWVDGNGQQHYRNDIYGFDNLRDQFTL